VSKLSVTALTAGLDGLGMDVAVLDPRQPSFTRSLLGYELVVPCLHGPYGEDGRLQGLLDYLRKPYACSGVAASAIAADKLLCKLTLVGLGIGTPRWQQPGEGAGDFLARCGMVMVKPRMGGSSVGMTLAGHDDDLARALELAAATDGMEPLVEEFAPGDPVTVGLLQLPSGVITLPPLATRPRLSDFYDARAKMDPRGEGLVTYEEAHLAGDVTEQLRRESLRIWHGIGCAGMARVDYIVTAAGPLALEVNTVPGLSTDSNLITAASLAGITYQDVVLALLHEALHRPQPDVPLPALSPVDLAAPPGPQEG
jgi:D-alanine-D-alanine ligase